jgi:hypothetical protein
MSKTKVQNAGSIRAARHPYLRATFWMDPRNHYWETPHYTEAEREKLRERNIDWLNSTDNRAEMRMLGFL